MVKFPIRITRSLSSKALCAFALLFVFETLMPPLAGTSWVRVPELGEERERAVAYTLDVVKGHKTGLAGLEEARLAEVIVKESRKRNLDPFFVMAIIKTESTFYNWSVSKKGALGLMQILPSTGRSLAGDLKLAWSGDATLFDPYANVKMGIYYLSVLKRIYNGDEGAALAAYNNGPGALNVKLSSGDDAPNGFALKVFENYHELKAGMEH